MEHRILREPPDDGANSIDMAVHDIQKRVWLLLEGTVCGIREIANRNEVQRLTKRNKTNVSTTHTSQHNIWLLGELSKRPKDPSVLLRHLNKPDTQQIKSKITSEKETRYCCNRAKSGSCHRMEIVNDCHRMEIVNDYTVIRNLLGERTTEKELDILLERYTQEKTIRKLRFMTLA